MKGEFVEGDIIPTIGIRHFSPEFAKLNGLRIVRIASHPNLVNKGLGKAAVKQIIKEYQSYDWIGVSFGATTKLIKFWGKLGFKTIHIRPIRTPGTGEWNVILVHPNSDRARNFVNRASRDFFLQFIYLLKQSLFELKPELALEIIRTIVNISDYEPRITGSGKYRLQKYIMGNLNFLLTVDVLQELVLSYFVQPMEIRLSSGQEKLLIARILQGRTWGQTLGRTGLSWKVANGLLKKAIIKINDNYNQKEENSYSKNLIK
jgi:tRNA(Met) cytidine acetyltransferase